MTKEDISVNVVCGLESVPKKEWDELIDSDNIQLTYDYLSVMQKNLCNDFEYYTALVYNKLELIAGVCMLIDKKFDFGNSIFGFWGKIIKYAKIKFKSLQVISPVAEYNAININSKYKSEEGIIKKVLVESIEYFAKKKKLCAIVWRDYLKVLDVDSVAKKYTHIYYMPGTILHLGCDCFDDYLGKLNKKKRHNIRSKIKKVSSDLNIEVVTGNELSELELLLCYKCYLQTLNNCDMKYDKLSDSYFQNCADKLGNTCKMLVARYKGTIVGAAQLLENNDIVVNVRMGMEYIVASKLQLYYHMLYANIDYCIENQKKHLYLSQTCYRAKLEVGAQLVPLHTYIHFLNPFLNRVVNRIAINNYKRYEELVVSDCPVEVLKKYESHKFAN